MSFFNLKSKILAFPYWKSIKTGFSKRNKIDVRCLAELKEPRLKDNEKLFRPEEELPTVRPFTVNIKVKQYSKIKRISGIPPEYVKKRKVRIFQPTKNVMQSGTDNIQEWEIEFDTEERWENPLMGWTATGDPHSNFTLQFPSKELAIRYCDKNCWTYVVLEKTSKEVKIRPYSDNYSWNTRKRVSTK